MAKRRSPSEGSIYPEDGGWRGSAEIGRGPNGERLRKKFRGQTKREVRRKIREAQDAYAKGQPIYDEKRTVTQFLTVWIEDALPGAVRHTTYAQYERTVKNHLIPHLGGIRLSLLSPEDVQNMLQKMGKLGDGPRTRQLARAVLRRALGQAEKWGYVQRNVAKLVDPPRVPRRDLDPLTLEEVRRLLAAARGTALEALVTLLVTTGLRKGEALALRWDAVNVEERYLQVSGTLQRKKGGGLCIDEPKTKGSRRNVPLTRMAVNALDWHATRQKETRLAAGPSWQDYGFIFTTDIGTPIDPSNLTRRFHRICEHAGIGRRRIHALRHSAATLLHSQNIPLEVVSEMLGHASLSITKDIYTKLADDRQQQAAEKMGALLEVV